jgi:hypothetical protein
MNKDAIAAIVLLIAKYEKQAKMYDVWYETWEKTMDDAKKLRDAIDSMENPRDIIEDLEELKDVLKGNR